MANLIKTEQKLFNGIDYDTVYTTTSADLIIETPLKKVLTSDERDKITDKLTTYNTGNKLVKLESGVIPTELIPDLANKLNVANPTFTGIMQGPSIYTAAIDNPDGFLLVSGDNGITFGTDQGVISFSGNTLNDVATPTLPTQAANKEYVDSLAAIGVYIVGYVVAAAPANVDIFAGISTIDNIVLSAGDRILLTSQTNVSENGIYTVNASHIATKVAADSRQGSYVFVSGGNTYNDWYFVNTDGNIWLASGRPDTIKANNGLTKNGNYIGLDSTSAQAIAAVATKLNIANPTYTGTLTGNRIEGTYGAPNFHPYIEFDNTKSYVTVGVDTVEFSGFLDVGGITSEGGIALSYSKATEMGSPTDDNDGANKKYVDARITSGTGNPSVVGHAVNDIYFKVLSTTSI